MRNMAGWIPCNPRIVATETSSRAALAFWRALALALAAAIAVLAFAAYTQPELLLNYSGLRFCG
jgi:anti-sigma-K factor RskA